MVIEVSWLVQERVIYVKYSGNIQVTDFAQAGQAIEGMLKELAHPVHLLHDHRKTLTLPLDITGLVKAVRPALEMSNGGVQLTFGGLEPTLAIIAKWVTSVIKTPYKHFKTKNQALLFLNSIIPNVPDPDNEVV